MIAVWTINISDFGIGYIFGATVAAVIRLAVDTFSNKEKP